MIKNTRLIVALAIAAISQMAASEELSPPLPASTARAESTYYQGYSLLKLRLSPFAESSFPNEEKQGWKLMEQAASQGSAKAMRRMGIYWANHNDRQKAKSYLQRALAAGDAQAAYELSLLTEGADAGSSAELKSALGKFKSDEADKLLLRSAEMGYPTAQQDWCVTHRPAAGSVDEARCHDWWKEGAARGDGPAWGAQGHKDGDDRSIIAMAYDEGNAVAGGSLSPIWFEEGLTKNLDDEQPFSRCTSYLGHFSTRFLFVFNEQLCVPPRPHWPAWRGLGKNFKAPPASTDSERIYQEGLQKMAQQDLSGGGALLKKSADLGNTGAMINLALVYITNPQDFFPPPETVNASKPSYTLLIKADAAGDVRAHYLLAFANDHGVSVPMKERIDVAHASVIPTNRLKAEKLEYEAAEAGLSRAQYALGWRLIRDERNAEGWDWLKKSFDNGERIAGFDLYRIAHYVWKDDAQAMQYLHASAVQGELASVELLAQAYEEGQLGQAKNATLAQCYRGIVERYKSQTWDQRMDLRLPDLDKTCH